MAVCAATICVILLQQCVARAQEAASAIPREHHVWGKFKPGAWTLLRITTEELDSDGKVSNTSTAETRTTLVSVDDKGVELRIEGVIEVAGKRFAKKPVVASQTFNGAENGQAEFVKQVGSEEIELDGKRIACDVRRVEIKKADMIRNVKVLYAAAQSPYVLRRETDEKGGGGNAYQSITDVVALDMPFRVLNNIKSTAHSRTVLRNGKSIVTTLSVMTMDVPGGVVMESSKEVDLEGKLVRQTTVELVDYGLEPQGESAKARREREKKPLFARWRARRDEKLIAKGAARSDIKAPEPADAAAPPDIPTITPVSRRESR